MAYEVGTASNAGDLMLKLETFLTSNQTLVQKGQQWQSLKDNQQLPYSTDYDMNASSSYQLGRCFVGGGLDKQDKIYVPMWLYVEKGNTYYTMAAYTARSWDVTKKISEQWTATNVENGIGAMALWNAEIPYWFFANGRRFMIIAKVANRYMSMYCGFFMPCGTDREYSYPYYIGGNFSLLSRNYQHQGNTENGAFWKPTTTNNRSSGTLVAPDGALVQCGTKDMEYPPTRAYETGKFGMVAEFFPYQINAYVGKTVDNQYVIKPIEIVQIRHAIQCLGWLDGAFYVSGFENSPETIITVNGENYICFPTMVRTGFNDYCAIKME